jgi:hypothetical protein
MMPRRIPGWFSRHPNLFALTLVTVVFAWGVVRIGNESEERVAAERRTAEVHKRLEAKVTNETRARQEIICLVLTDGVDRDRAFIDALVAASESTDRSDETEKEKRQRREATRIFFERLEPSLRPIECNKFIQDPIKYLEELRRRTDFTTSKSTTTIPVK